MNEIKDIVIEIACDHCEYNGCCDDNEINECISIIDSVNKLKEFIEHYKAETVNKIYSQFEKFVKSQPKTNYYWTEFWCEFVKICEEVKKYE